MPDLQVGAMDARVHPLPARRRARSNFCQKCTGGESNPYALRRRNLKPNEDDGLGAIPQDSAASEDDHARDDAGSYAMPPRSAAAIEPSDAEIERGILDALAKGLDGVAQTLSVQLRERQGARAG